MISRLQKLAGGECPVYVATRLFDNGGRYFGAKMETGCAAGVKKALEQLDIPVTGNLTYLPFRDSNESVTPRPGETFTGAIYRVDREMLTGSFALFAPVYDMCQDSGISYELGLAAANRIPIVLLAGNFFQWSIEGRGVFSVEPMYLIFSDEVIETRAMELSDGDKTPEGYLRKLDAEFESITEQTAVVFSRLCASVSASVGPPPDEPSTIRRSRRNGNVHLEFGGGQYDFQRYFAEVTARRLRSEGFSVSISDRYQAGSYRDGVATDVESLENSEAAIFLGDGADVDPEIAFLLGYVGGKNIPIVLYYSGTKSVYASPEYHTPRNLMVCESAHSIVRTPDELVKQLSRLCSVETR